MQDDVGTKPQEPSNEALAALGRLGKALGDPAARRRFTKDPHGVVDGFEHLPEPVRDMLSGLSDDELAVLGRMNETFVGHGLFVKDKTGGTVGIL